MDPEPNHVRRLFEAALELTGADREAYLDGECAGAPELRAEVGRLLAQHERAESEGFLDPAGVEAAPARPTVQVPHGHHIKCPHCHGPIEVVTPPEPAEVTCPSCGSTFKLGEAGTATWRTPPRAFGRFTGLTEIGKGGQGNVYRAYDPQLDRMVALKIPRLGNLSTPEDRATFFREARNAAQLRHPGIVSVHEVGEHEGIPYILSDYIEGQSLADLLSDPLDRPSFRDSAELVADVADALHEAHRAGVIHRDVKPANVLLDRASGRPLVADFGMAKREAGEVTIAVTGQVLGTVAYMPPEQAAGRSHDADARSDVYSLGVVLYQMLTGELPFRGTDRRMLDQIAHDEPKPLRALNDRIPRDLETITLKAMAKEPHRRYPTAAELAADLRRWLGGEPIMARPAGRIEKAWRWSWRHPAAAGLIAVSLVAASASTAVGVGMAYNAQLRQANQKLRQANRTEAAARKVAEAERTRAARLVKLFVQYKGWIRRANQTAVKAQGESNTTALPELPADVFAH